VLAISHGKKEYYGGTKWKRTGLFKRTFASLRDGFSVSAVISSIGFAGVLASQ
jgi:hypothetical protein